MARKEQLTEDLKYRLEVLKLVWLSLLAASGGTIGLTLSELGFRRLAIVAGIVVMVGLVTVGVAMHRSMRKIIQQLEEV
jgi:hypothetical protein